MKREENQTVEYKESWHEKYLEWICGYANAKGGMLYIGIEDGTKKPVGVKNANKLMWTYEDYEKLVVESCRNGMRFDDTQSRLFELIHGRDDPRRPIPLDDTRAKVVRALIDVGSPDEFIYVFDPDEEHGKVGLLARYGDWSCEAYYPCGCACAHYNGYWESLKTNHTSSVYLESDKAKWLEKIRPLAKELYEEEVETMCDDDKTIDTRRSSTCNED